MNKQNMTMFGNGNIFADVFRRDGVLGHMVSSLTKAEKADRLTIKAYARGAEGNDKGFASLLVIPVRYRDIKPEVQVKADRLVYLHRAILSMGQEPPAGLPEVNFVRWPEGQVHKVSAEGLEIESLFVEAIALHEYFEGPEEGFFKQATGLRILDVVDAREGTGLKRIWWGLPEHLAEEGIALEDVHVLVCEFASSEAAANMVTYTVWAPPMFKGGQFTRAEEKKGVAFMANPNVVSCKGANGALSRIAENHSTVPDTGYGFGSALQQVADLFGHEFQDRRDDYGRFQEVDPSKVYSAIADVEATGNAALDEALAEIKQAASMQIAESEGGYAKRGWFRQALAQVCLPEAAQGMKISSADIKQLQARMGTAAAYSEFGKLFPYFCFRKHASIPTADPTVNPWLSALVGNNPFQPAMRDRVTVVSLPDPALQVAEEEEATGESFQARLEELADAAMADIVAVPTFEAVTFEELDAAEAAFAAELKAEEELLASAPGETRFVEVA